MHPQPKELTLQGARTIACRRICFCFRLIDSFTERDFLNVVCNKISRFIHSEVYDAQTLKTLYITAMTRVNKLEVKQHDAERWRFLWLDLSEEKYRIFTDISARILADQIPFSAANAYLFPFYSSCLYLQCSEDWSTNCAITTMQIVKELWGADVVTQSTCAMTPAAIYDLILQLRFVDGGIKINDALTESNTVPAPALLPKTTGKTQQGAPYRFTFD